MAGLDPAIQGHETNSSIGRGHWMAGSKPGQDIVVARALRRLGLLLDGLSFNRRGAIRACLARGSNHGHGAVRL